VDASKRAFILPGAVAAIARNCHISWKTPRAGLNLVKCFANNGQHTKVEFPRKKEGAVVGKQKSKKLFLMDQRIVQLNENIPANFRGECVCGEGHPNQDKYGLDKNEEVWSMKTRDEVRHLIAGDQPLQRVMVACDAGTGKTTNMHWLHSQVARHSRRQVSLLLRLDHSEDVHLLYEQCDDADALLKRLARQIVPADTPERERLFVQLSRLKKDGRITLLIDGLDHAISHSGLKRTLETVIEHCF
jgi:hypothetical protein